MGRRQAGVNLGRKHLDLLLPIWDPGVTSLQLLGDVTTGLNWVGDTRALAILQLPVNL